jgi:dUTPase
VCDIREWDLQRLCQLTAGDLLPWAEIIVVDELPGAATVRGEGGFGSTGAA